MCALNEIVVKVQQQLHRPCPRKPIVILQSVAKASIKQFFKSGLQVGGHQVTDHLMGDLDHLREGLTRRVT